MVMDMKDRREEFENEAGYVLLAVIFLTVILLISLAIAAPKLAKSIQRDKELETIHRGEQYKRAIKLYYQKFGSYPTSIDQLVQTNQMRFLRKKYTDPLTGKDDWKPVLFGRAHVRPLGFFGQPLMTAGAVAGAGSMYAIAVTTTTDANGVPIAGGDQSGTGAAGGSAGSGFGSSGSGFGSSGSGFGFTGSSFGQQGGTSFGQPTPGMGSSTGSPNGTSGTGTSATTFGGGGPIVGFTLPVDKPSLVDYKLQTRYNKWEFNYDPTEEQAQALSGLSGGTPTGTNPTGTPGSPGNTPGQNAPGQPSPNPSPAPTPPGPTDPTAPQ
jgi:type II secretory pathway pseudopilin PulG